MTSDLLCPTFWFPALLEFNQSVLVSRKDPESRRKAVAQLNERLTSKGYWPQVGGALFVWVSWRFEKNKHFSTHSCCCPDADVSRGNDHQWQSADQVQTW